MKRLFLFLLILLLPGLSAFPDQMPVLTVLDFEATNVSESEMRSIINFLSSAIFRTGKYTVIDVSQRDTILKEMEFSMSGCTDETCLLEVGKMLSAEIIVTGSIGRVGSRYLFSAKLLETETGKTIHTADGVYGDLDALIDDLESIAIRLTSAGEDTGGEPSSRIARERKTVEWRTLGAWSSAGGGLLGILGGSLVLYNASVFYRNEVIPCRERYENLDGATSDLDFEIVYEEYSYTYADYRTRVIQSIVLISTGAILGGVSIWLFLGEGKRDNRAADLAVSLYPHPRGVLLSFALSY